MSNYYNQSGHYSENNFKRNDTKRKSVKETDKVEQEDDKHHASEEKLSEYMRHLLTEKSIIDAKECPFAYKFIDEEITRIQQKLVKGPPRDTKYVDVYNDRPVKITSKVLMPLKEHPRFNFVGKLLGPKGSTLKQLQEETMCYMNICGRGSMRDREKEDELRNSLDPKYAHLTDDLHVEISTIAAPAKAHTRMASALTYMRKYLVPDYNSPEIGERAYIPKKLYYKKSSIDDDEWENAHKRHLYEDEMEHVSIRKNSRMPHSSSSSKSTVMSILNKARIAMQESYGYEGRRIMKRVPEYADDDSIDYHPKMKRYHEGSSYGKSIHDIDFKKRTL